ATPGDELILTNYEHHPVDSPYRMRFAIFVRKGEERFDAVDTVPEQLRKRMLAVRPFDKDAMMIAHELAGGRTAGMASHKLSAAPRASERHRRCGRPRCCRP